MSEELNPAQRKRLQKLQSEYEQPSSFPGKFESSDLLLLLQHDGVIRSTIAAIAGKTDALKTTIVTITPAPAAASSSAVLRESGSLRHDLQEPLALLTILDNDPGLLDAWAIRLEGEEGMRMVALVAHAANWDKIELLWDVLAHRCKRDRRAATQDEARLLQGCLCIYNLILTGRQAELLDVNLGTQYDFRNHERSGGVGEEVVRVWLLGLKNGGGVVRKRALVETR